MPLKRKSSRKSKATRKKPTTALTKKYRSVKKKQFKKKMLNTVRRAQSKAISNMTLLRQPKAVMVKFNYSFTKLYRLMPSIFGHTSVAGTDGVAAGQVDDEPQFPVNGLEIKQNSLFEPIPSLTGVHANGFNEFARQYGKYRVVGSKTTCKVRRMGMAVPLAPANGGAGVIHTQHHSLPAADALAGPPTDSQGQGAYPNTQTSSNSQAADLGSIFDPSTADPLLVMLIDRSSFQDISSTVHEDDIDEYTDLRKYQHLKGLQWRELKAGPAQKTSLVHKFSEKTLKSTGNNTDYRQQNTGSFPQEDTQSMTSHNGVPPITEDKMILKIKPFDKTSEHKQTYSQARLLVTVDMEFIVRCDEARYAFSHNN